MKMLARSDASHAFVRQAENCRSTGSSFVASVLEAVHRQLSLAPRTCEMVRTWTGDPAAAAVALRVNGALHALARRGNLQHLTDLYRGEHDDFDGSIAEALAQEDAFIADWMRYPTQTNEVARGAAIISALMAIAELRPMPFELLELGASCGLNLNLGRYAYHLGGVRAGDISSAVRIRPEWRGEDPPMAPVAIAAARGVDLSPLSADDPSHRERLLSFTWADQPARSQRLEAALEIAVAHPPRVHKGDARLWLAQRLADRQPEGVCRAVVHTMFLQYLGERDRRDIATMIAAAGAGATAERPLVEIGLEWTADRREVQLRCTRWPEGESAVLATCHPYGDWVEWRGFGGRDRAGDPRAG
ncbi:DUF2332 domain-containing protein [Phenylobacterium sp. J367]|uniref:DUF2332 domain-containing protein n=1 Tax=Phenylobacterium sp. J367 TaxID=2898435 RepID=UPI002150B60C|nr:DUF2332 family protein [Phenylobacterium sp. J367]MCR5878021.1 DUF2332 family protein [Phenylobacterium sp. J367]